MTADTGSTRPWDIVLFGASGFVGKLIAKTLTEVAPTGLRWAIAGRSPAKLRELHGAIEPRPGEPAIGVIEADVDRPASISAMAAATKVLLTTVGPYVRWGEPVASACVEAGTHYLDLTGEPAYVAGLVARLHERAQRRGVALVPCCGFDSIPTDIGVFYTVGLLPQGVPIEVRGYMQGNGSASGGTLASALGIVGDRTPNVGRTIAPPTSGDGRSIGRVRQGPHRSRALGCWALPLPTIDPSIALRSAGMLGRYGPDFRYGHYIAQRWLPMAVATAVGGGLLIGAAKLPPVARLLTRLRPPGTGPSAERRAESWFRFRFVGEGGGRRVITEIRGGDPGYDETSKMVAESAILLAQGGEREGGVLTPASAFGQALVDRLGEVGLGLRQIEG